MFEFITISNGVAIVQHGATGHVYRFRPTHPGVWSSLTLQTVDPCDSSDGDIAEHAAAALFFAEAAAAACCSAAAETMLPLQFAAEPLQR